MSSMHNINDGYYKPLVPI